VGFALLRAFGAGFVRFSATNGGFDPRLPVMSAHSGYAPFLAFIADTIPPLIPKVEYDVRALGTFLPD
jgi:hypothetical protein